MTVERERLAALADLLIPAADGMPSASEAGLDIDAVLAARPDLVQPLRAALDHAAGSEPADALRTLRAEQPAVFAAFGEVVAGAYFLTGAVQDRIGYHGRAAIPVTDLTDEDRALLEPVVHRGRIYRDDPRDAP
jgi:hypothetical protein